MPEIILEFNLITRIISIKTFTIIRAHRIYFHIIALKVDKKKLDSILIITNSINLNFRWIKNLRDI